MQQLLLFGGSEELGPWLEDITVELVGLELLRPLQTQGPNYIRLCPFHQERNASFYIRPTQDRFVCYGCGTTGGPFGLLAELEYSGVIQDCLTFIVNHVGDDLRRGTVQRRLLDLVEEEFHRYDWSDNHVSHYRESLENYSSPFSM